jgi:hypothetical protein
MSFDTLKRNSQSAIEKLVSEAEKLASKGGFQKDDSFWSPTVDKAGNGFAVIRFLPAKEGEELPWVRWWDHGFKGKRTGRWYIENSLTTLGQDDPVSEANSLLWNSGIESDKEIARDRKRRLHYCSNIEVLSDSGTPENNGRVARYKYGKKIFDKIMDAMQPKFEDETPINPFDFWTGANFKIKIRNVEGHRNYDKSEFDAISMHHDGDETKLKEIYENLLSLQEVIDPKNFKSYAELKSKFLAVIGESEASVYHTTAQSAALESSASPRVSRVSEEPSLPSIDDDPDDEIPFTHDSDEKSEDTLSYFAQLAKG